MREVWRWREERKREGLDMTAEALLRVGCRTRNKDVRATDDVTIDVGGR
jgi:hypothetical protein